MGSETVGTGLLVESESSESETEHTQDELVKLQLKNGYILRKSIYNYNELIYSIICIL